jgi:N-acetylmuramoyl-L-alanine amidase|tara:strand:+ start:364 stop:1086 length:723 start_codon:yes stop_codon:yes gene_type:complete
MQFNKIYTKNFSKKTRKLGKIEFLIIHYTGMQSKRASIKKLLNNKIKKKVSCHYLIDRQGKLIQIVEDNKIAWHAGESKWNKYKNLNANSIGIELVNKGHDYGYEVFTNKQINKLIELILFLKKKYKIKKSNILGHSDIAPLRKKDPGEKFPWNKLAKKGLGTSCSKTKKNIDIFQVKKNRILFFKNLYKIGYRYFQKNKILNSDKLVIKAFQRRFLQDNINGIIDQETLKISHILAKNN